MAELRWRAAESGGEKTHALMPPRRVAPHTLDFNRANVSACGLRHLWPLRREWSPTELNACAKCVQRTAFLEGHEPFLSSLR